MVSDKRWEELNSRLAVAHRRRIEARTALTTALSNLDTSDEVTEADRNDALERAYEWALAARRAVNAELELVYT